MATALAVAVLSAPWFTQAVTRRLDRAATTGLSASQAADLAEQVRRFVTTSDAPSLPAHVDGRAVFGPAAVSHLADVRDVMLASRVVGSTLAAALAIWFAVCLRLGRKRQVASALRSGGWVCIAAPAVLAVAGLVDFDGLFTAFHWVFFDAGTWLFPADSLLIQLYPVGFWTASAAALALLVTAQGAVLLLAGRALSERVPPPDGAEHGIEA